MLSHPQTQPPRGTFDAEGASKTLQPYVIDTRGLTKTFKKAEIALDTLTTVLGGEPQTRVTPADWRDVAFVPNREQWAAYSGDYQSSQPLRIYREGDKLLGGGRGFGIEFVPLSDTAFVMVSDLGALDEQPAEFTRQADGRTVFLSLGQALGVKR